MKITPEDEKIADQINDYLLGTCNTEFDAAEAFGVESEKILDIVENLDIELCEVCSWWCETHEIDSDGICGDCR